MFDLASKIQEEGMMLGRKEGITQGREEGISLGKVEGILQCIQNLMSKSSCSIEEAFSLLDVSTEEQEKIRTVLNQ